MKFTTIRLTGRHIIDLPILNASSSDKYILKGADGLGPPGVEISMLNTRASRGYYQGKKTQLREIVIRVGLNLDYSTTETVADLRSKFYGFLSPGMVEDIRVEFVNDTTPVAYTTGYVKQLEIVPFSKTPEIQITITCDEKFLISPSATYVEAEGANPLSIYNLGSAPTGLYFEVLMESDMDTWSLSNDKGESFTINWPFEAFQKLIVNTSTKNRQVLLDDGVNEPVNVISGFDVSSRWLYLYPGDNTLTPSVSSFEWGEISYQAKYWGI